MKLGVYSLHKVLFQGEAASVSLNTSVGEVTILDQHEPLISIVEKGIVKIVDRQKKETFFQVSSGFLEVDAGSQVKIMVEADAQ